MEINHLLGFFLLSVMVCSAPGTSMFFIILQGLSKNRQNILAGILGLLTANIFWILLCAFGIGIITSISIALFNLLRYLGALYLIILGFLILIKQNPTSRFVIEKTSMSFLSTFTKGFLTSMTNPKAFLFYISFLPQFTSSNSPYVPQILFLGLCNLMVIGLVMSFYGLTASTIATKFFDSKFETLLKQIMGVGFIGFGMSLFRYNPSK